MERKFVEDFFAYCGILLIILIVAYFVLRFAGQDEFAIEVLIIGAICAFLFGLTGFLFKRHSDNQKLLPKGT